MKRLPLLALALAFVFTACDKDAPCNKAVLSFNNKTGGMIGIKVAGMTGDSYRTLNNGSSISFEVVPRRGYNYFIINPAGDLIKSGTESVEPCVSQGIDLR